MAKLDGEVGGNARCDFTRKQRWPDVVSYLRLVKRTFENEQKKYHDFLRIMVDRKHRRTSVAHLIERVRALFKEHKELINGFYQFVPEKYRAKDGTRFEDATNFLIKIKARFLHDPQVYDAFLQIVDMYRTGVCDAHHTFQAVKYLFKGHPDLIEEYQKYLPRRSVILPQSQPTVMPALSPGSVVASGTSRVKKDVVLDYLRTVKERFQDRQGTYIEFLVIMKDYESQRIDTHKLVAAVRNLFRGNNDLIQGFDIFLPEEYRLDEKTLNFDHVTDLMRSHPTVMPALSPGLVVATGTGQVKKNAALNYLQRVKERFQDRQGTYIEFLGIMKGRESQRTKTRNLVAAVRDLFRGNSDLIQGFDIFLPEVYRLDEKSLDFDHATDFIQSQPNIMPALSAESVVAYGTSRVKKNAALDYSQRIKKRFQDRKDRHS